MSRKGYEAEYIVKKKLIENFGRNGVVKVAISQFGGDFLVIIKGKLYAVIEVKHCHRAKYYEDEKAKSQMERIREFCREHECRGELWIKYPHKDIEVRDLMQ